MATQENVTPRQLDLARKALWHQDGKALRTFDSVREWINEAGLVPVYPHPQFASPAPSFAEAVLGRPENGWVPNAPKAQGAAAVANDEDDEFEADEPESEDDELAEDEEDEEFEDRDDDASDGEDDDSLEDDEDEPATDEGDEAMLSGDGNIPSDRETMLSDDDEFAEDEGDEIAEEDQIHAQGNPVPNDLHDGEAAVSEPAAQPVNGFTPEDREMVHRTLARLVEDGSVVPLNLLGSATGEPDYVVSASAFSFVYTLRGDKNWKSEPATTGPTRVSPLAVKAYEVLREQGGLAPHELSVKLGNGITDSAALRALSELWAIQRVLPLPDAEGRPAKWEVTTTRFLRHMKAGANAGQPTALSALLSLYLAQPIAATTDEMDLFLSPLSARSRVREVVNGLSASRQLEPLVVEGKTLLHITGALPEFPADTTEAVEQRPQRSRYEVDDRRAEMNERATRDAARPGDYPARRPAAARSAGERGGRPGFGSGDRPAFARGVRPSFGQRRAFGDGNGPNDRERRPFQRRDEQGGSDRPQGGSERSSFARPWDEERASRPARPFTPRDGGDRRGFAPREGGFAPREGGDRRPFTPRGDRPFQPREGGERRPFAPRGDRPFTPREGGERRPFTPRSDRPFTPREGGERRPFAPREGGERRPFTPRGDRAFQPREGGDRRPFPPRGDRPFTPRDGGDRGSFAPRGDRPFSPREGGERRPFTPREDRPFTPRDGGDRRPFPPRGDRPFTPREGGERRPFAPRGDRPFTPREGGEGRPSGGGFGRKPFGGGGFGGRPAFGGDRPQRDRFSGEPGEGRPSFQSGAHSAGPGGSKFGGSGFGRDRAGKAGGFGRPGAKPAFRGPGRGPARGGVPKRRPE